MENCILVVAALMYDFTTSCGVRWCPVGKYDKAPEVFVVVPHWQARLGSRFKRCLLWWCVGSTIGIKTGICAALAIMPRYSMNCGPERCDAALHCHEWCDALLSTVTSGVTWFSTVTSGGTWLSTVTSFGTWLSTVMRGVPRLSTVTSGVTWLSAVMGGVTWLSTATSGVLWLRNNTR